MTSQFFQIEIMEDKDVYERPRRVSLASVSELMNDARNSGSSILDLADDSCIIYNCNSGNDDSVFDLSTSTNGANGSDESGLLSTSITDASIRSLQRSTRCAPHILAAYNTVGRRFEGGRGLGHIRNELLDLVPVSKSIMRCILFQFGN